MWRCRLSYIHFRCPIIASPFYVLTSAVAFRAYTRRVSRETWQRCSWTLLYDYLQSLRPLFNPACACSRLQLVQRMHSSSSNRFLLKSNFSWETCCFTETSLLLAGSFQLDVQLGIFERNEETALHRPSSKSGIKIFLMVRKKNASLINYFIDLIDCRRNWLSVSQFLSNLDQLGPKEIVVLLDSSTRSSRWKISSEK